MEERRWSPRTGKPLEMHLRASSAGRFWNGLSAATYDTSDGVIEAASFPNHNLTMHAGSVVPTACRCDGLTMRRIGRPGDIDIVPAGYPGAWEDEAPTQMFVVNVTPALLRSTAEALGLKAKSIAIRPKLQLHDTQLAHLLWALKAELESPDPLGRVYAESIGTAIAVHVIGRYARIPSNRAANDLSKRRLRRVIDYIDDRLGGDLSLNELAQMAHLSPSHFQAVFKAATGVPVHQYVLRRRVEYAIDLLWKRLAVRDVALQAGFADQSHMTRCIRRVTGLTPSQILGRRA